MNFSDYRADGFFDEMIGEDGNPRAAARLLAREIDSLPAGELRARQKTAERALIQAGITFNVYSDNRGVEKTLPFDLVPRIVSGAEWNRLERGLRQRIHALNFFIDDLYHRQKCIKDRIVPRAVIESSKGFRPQCIGINPPRGIWCHITGTDLVRHRDGQIYVLEDNLRCPSGVSYVLENRQVMKRTFQSRLGIVVTTILVTGSSALPARPAAFPSPLIEEPSKSGVATGTRLVNSTRLAGGSVTPEKIGV
jgi:uncharacterized circularly permuted ATP-grasp superfamily protein